MTAESKVIGGTHWHRALDYAREDGSHMRTLQLVRDADNKAIFSVDFRDGVWLDPVLSSSVCHDLGLELVAEATAYMKGGL